MAIYCPIRKEKVVYLECLECEDKKCKEVEKETKETKETKKKNDVRKSFSSSTD